MTLTERFSEDNRRHICRKATLIALTILITVALAGLKLFDLFGITLPAFQIAGGILLLMVGMAQLNAVRRKVNTSEQDESYSRDDITVFPLATPLLAGPGAISTVILLATKATNWLRLAALLVAIVTCMGAAYAVLRSAKYLYKLLGNTGLNLFSRIMGLILTAIGVQFIVNGVHDFLPWLVSALGN
jgi:multiple antibiotic resistance protein